MSTNIQEVRMQIRKHFPLVLLALLLAAPVAAKVGISSQFVDVVIEGLRPGGIYNLREIKGVPYTVKNRGSSPQVVQVEAVNVDLTKLVDPYEPVPDPNWIRIEPSVMRIDPGEAGFGDVIISIPNDPALDGKHYQADIWARTVNTGFFSAGVRSRLRFSIGKGPQSLAAERRAKAMVNVNYDLWPSRMYVKEAQVGKKYDVKRKEKKSFKLTNRGEENIEFVFSAIPWLTTNVPTGYERITKLDWVKFKPSKVKVKGGRVKDVRMILDDAPEELRGKSIAFVVQVALPIGTPISATHRVFMTFPE
jgi:hypothetical protein